MPSIFPAVVRVEPSFVEPGLIIQQNQASGAFDLLGGGKPSARAGEAQYIYVKTLQIRTKIAAGQSAANQLPSCTVVGAEVSTPTYLMRVRAEYDHHDTAAASRWGVALPQAQSLGMRQAHAQQMRNSLLYGFNPQNGEGLLNAPGATLTNLPADSNGNTTFGTYDNGQLAFFLLSVVSALKQRMYQMGGGVRIVILGPQRVLAPMEYQDIVQLTQFQRPGAGTLSTKNTFQAQLEENGDTLSWNYDDTLQGKGAGGADAIFIVCPEINQPTQAGINTNTFADLQPSLSATTMQYTDMAAPREIPTPLPGGAIDVLSELRASSGWGLRPEGITIISGQP